jgi:type I restriction enzyme S subunit
LFEQERIVAEIDKQFTRLDAGVEALRQLQAHLRRYRAAVLKAACEGSLVLTRSPRAGWTVAKLGSLVLRMANGTTVTQSREPPGIPVTRIETIASGTIDRARVRYVRDAPPEVVQKYTLQAGDVLMSHINSDAHLGKTAVYDGRDGPLLHGMNLMLLRADTRRVLPEYLHIACNYLRTSGRFMAVAQHAVNQSSLNQKSLANLDVPLPPLDEQRRIVGAASELLAQSQRTFADGEACLRRAGRLRAAILSQAFEGRLVPAEQPARAPAA